MLQSIRPCEEQHAVEALGPGLIPVLAPLCSIRLLIDHSGRVQEGGNSPRAPLDFEKPDAAGASQSDQGRGAWS